MSTTKDEAAKPHIFRPRCHDGIWYPNFVLDSSIEGMKDFEVRPDDIWIVTYVKAGRQAGSPNGHNIVGGGDCSSPHNAFSEFCRYIILEICQYTCKSFCTDKVYEVPTKY